eukprot:gene7446-8233_t
MSDSLPSDLQSLPPSSPSSPSEGFPSCMDMLGFYTSCMNSGKQLANIYENGGMKDCIPFYEDWKSCLHATVSTNPNKKQELYEKSHYHQKKVAAIYANDIFEYKTKPGWY